MESDSFAAKSWVIVAFANIQPFEIQQNVVINSLQWASASDVRIRKFLMVAGG